MNWLDIAIIAVISVSALISLKRGFVKELLSLITWVVAVVIARVYAYDFSHYLTDYANDGKAALVLAFFVLFIGTLIAGSVVNFVVGQFVHAVGLTVMDRLLGTAFGLVRGAVVIVVVIGLTSLTPFTESQAWQSSQIVPHFAQVEEWTKETTKVLTEQLSDVDMSGLVDSSSAGELLKKAGEVMAEVPASVEIPEGALDLDSLSLPDGMNANDITLPEGALPDDASDVIQVEN